MGWTAMPRLLSLISLISLTFSPLSALSFPEFSTDTNGCEGRMPAPFTSPLRQGNDTLQVRVLKHLLSRTPTGAGNISNLSSTFFGPATASAVRAFQRSSGYLSMIQPTGILDRVTALALLDNDYTDDGYEDDGRAAADYPGGNYLYKILIPVHRNRSVQTNATFLDAQNNPLFHFPVRSKGHVHDGCGEALPEAWPNFNDTGFGLNQFSSGGMTPTGLTEIDLNSPEGDDRLYGPYPVTRFVRGLSGNAAFLVPDLRNGILIHTGKWPGWKEGEPMPNSAGCVHTWPEDVKRIWQTATSLHAEVRKNPFSRLPYPFKPQALVSVFLVDR